MLDIAVGVMKIGYTVPKAELKHTFLVFRANMLPLHHVGSLTHHYTYAHLSVWLFESEVSADYSNINKDLTRYCGHLTNYSGKWSVV